MSEFLEAEFHILLEFRHFIFELLVGILQLLDLAVELADLFFELADAHHKPGIAAAAPLIALIAAVADIPRRHAVGLGELDRMIRRSRGRDAGAADRGSPNNGQSQKRHR